MGSQVENALVIAARRLKADSDENNDIELTKSESVERIPLLTTMSTSVM